MENSITFGHFRKPKQGLHENFSTKYNAHIWRSDLSTHVHLQNKPFFPSPSLPLSLSLSIPRDSLSTFPPHPFYPLSPENQQWLSPLLLAQIPDQSSLCLRTAPHGSAYPILTSSGWQTLQCGFVYLTHLSSGTHNNPVHCLFVSPLFRTERRESDEEGGGGVQKQKRRKQLSFPSSLWTPC